MGFEQSEFHRLSAWHNEKLYDASRMFLSGVEAELTQCWQDTDSLFRLVPDWSVQPIEVRHPFCFYYGHLSSFTKLNIFADEPTSDLDMMFSRGIDPVVLNPTQCHGHPEIPPEWPKREEVISYVNAIRKRVLAGLVDDPAAAAGDRRTKQVKLVTFVLEHERMHLETLGYMMTQEKKAAFEKNVDIIDLECQQKNNTISPPTTMSIAQSLGESEMIRIEAGEVVLGADASRNVFMWDNEYPEFHTNVSSSFLVSAQPVSIREFYRFMLEGGYEDASLWEMEDFEYIKQKGFKCPATWSCVVGEVKESGDVAFDYYVHEFQTTNHWAKVAHQPVFVSLSEAQAFCRWVSGVGGKSRPARIMTEAEYQRILDVDHDEKRVQQMRTGGWEWTSTPFEPFPGFQAMAEYPEYSTDFFDGNHFVLKGSSPVTHPSMRRDSFRNYYQKQYPYVFAKFRCCR